MMKVGEVAKELSVCPCVVPRLVKLGRLSASTTPEGEMDINPESVRDYKLLGRGRKYVRA
jgi:predicted site-specific integrase-resolvase